MTDIAIDSMTLIFSDPNIQGTIIKIGPASTKCKHQGTGYVLDGYEVSVSAITYPTAGATIPDAGPYSANFSSSAQKSKGENELVCLQGDETGTINATPQIPGTPPLDYPISFTVQIQNSGQTKEKSV